MGRHNDRMGWGARLRALRMDLGPFREHRDFRLLFAAGTVFYLGGMVSYVAVPYQIYQLTGSNFAVGALALVELLPLIVFGLYGGALADHVDRRRMLVLCRRRPGRAHVAAARERDAAQPQRVDDLCRRVLPVDRAVAAATEPRGADPAHRPARRDRGRLRGLVARHAGRHPARSRRSAALLVGTVGVSWAYGVDVAGLVIATILFLTLHAYPPTDLSHAAEHRGHRVGHPLCRRPSRPARHLRHRHGGDVHGDADRAVPGLRRDRAAGTHDARPALHGRECRHVGSRR